MRSVWFASYILITLIASGCSLAGGAKGPTIETVQIGACDPLPCAKVSIATLPELPAQFASEAREAIAAQVDRALYAPIDDVDEEVSRERFLASITEQYEEYLTVKSPDVSVDWQVSRGAFVIYSNSEIASVVVKTDGYLGGAHGFMYETIYVFDGKTGRALSWDDVISAESRAVLLKAAEAEFRRSRGLSARESLQEAGFQFDGDAAFGLAANFAITNKGIELHYNPYEIGPYVMGSTDLTVPMEVVSALLRSDAINVDNLVASGGE